MRERGRGGNSSTPSGKAREQAAALVGVNPHYVTDAKKVKAKDPELFEKVPIGASQNAIESGRPAAIENVPSRNTDTAKAANPTSALIQKILVLLQRNQQDDGPATRGLYPTAPNPPRGPDC